jgi:hypothetical protein
VNLNLEFLLRMLKEQTNIDDQNNITAKASKDIYSNSLQNPMDTDVTYVKMRKK